MIMMMVCACMGVCVCVCVLINRLLVQAKVNGKLIQNRDVYRTKMQGLVM